MAVRLKDIAQDLGVSVITASKALRGSSDISEETRARVLERMRQLNYRPNMAARALATGQTYILGLVVPDLVHPFFAEVAKALGDSLRVHGYGLILASSGEDPEIEQSEMRMMLARGVDALLIASCQPGLKGFFGVEDQRIPFILIDRNFPQLRANFVGTDDYAGGLMATEHLLEIGRTRLAHIAGPDLSPAADRLMGFEAALRRRGLEVRTEAIVRTSRVEELGDEAGYSAMRQLMRLDPRPDAVFCYNDLTAIGAIQAVLDAGLRVPEDVAVIGFGNVRYSKYLRVPLTSMEQNNSELGQLAAELALELVKENLHAPKSVQLKPRLIARASTGFATQDGPDAISVGSAESVGSPSFASKRRGKRTAK